MSFIYFDAGLVVVVNFCIFFHQMLNVKVLRMSGSSGFFYCGVVRTDGAGSNCLRGQCGKVVALGSPCARIR